MSKASKRLKRLTRAGREPQALSARRTSVPARLLGWAAVLVLISAGLAAYRYAGIAEDPQVQAARHALEQREFATATKLLTDYLDEAPDDIGARLLAAQAARRSGNYLAASQHLRRCTAVGALPALCELESRLLTLAQGETSQADFFLDFCNKDQTAPETPLILEALIEADLLRLSDPLDIPRVYPLGESPPELKRLQRATDLWLETQPNRPNQIQGLVWRGRVRSMAGDHTGSLADFQAALVMDEDHFEASAYQALSIATEQPREALAQLERLRERYPGDRRLPFAIAPLLRSAGETERAAKLFDEMLRTNPDSPQLLVERAQVSLDLKRPAEAKQYLDRAAKVAPDAARLHLALARYMVMVGDAKGAQEHQKRFLAQEADRAR